MADLELKLNNQTVELRIDGAGIVSELVAQAQAAAASALAYSDVAQLAALTAPDVYEAIDDGLAAVADGETFWSVTDGVVSLYRRVGAAAEVVTTIAPTAVFIPDQANFTGSLALGNGLRLLSHATGDEGRENIALGTDAGLSMTSGYYNLLVGPLTGKAMTGSNVPNTYGGGLGNVGNVGIGKGVFQVANGALDNTAIGVNSQQNLTTGMDNASLGINSLRNIEGGSECVAIGHGALQHLVGFDDFATGYGHRMTALGDMAGRFLNGGLANKIEGNTSVYVGAQTQSAGNAVENETVIGYAAQGQGSHTVVLGSDDVEATFLKGRIDVGVNGAQSRVHVMAPPGTPLLESGIRVSRPGAPLTGAILTMIEGSDVSLLASRYTGTPGQLWLRVTDGVAADIDAVKIDGTGAVSLPALGASVDAPANMRIDPTTKKLSPVAHPGGWQTYTPTISATTGGVWGAVTVNKARYNRFNGLIFVMIDIALPGSITGFSGNLEISLPTGVADMTTPFAASSHTTGQTLRAMTRPSTSPAQGIIQLATNANGTTIAANAQASITGFYVPA